MSIIATIEGSPSSGRFRTSTGQAALAGVPQLDQGALAERLTVGRD
jgi:hypothetical protein